jgi:transcription elongation GreA/GreB family factor
MHWIGIIKDMVERVYVEEIEPGITETLTYGNVEFPKFLITRASRDIKLGKIKKIIDKAKKDLAEGTPSGDAGDTHGQFHNEIGWYKEQMIAGNLRLASEIGEGLDRAIVIQDYDELRCKLEAVGTRPGKRITISSKVLIQYGAETEDREHIMLVAPLDGGENNGWVSVESPLAKSIEDKFAGESGQFKINKQLITTINIISVE